MDAARHAAGLCRPLHDLRRRDAILALDIYARHPRLSARDSVFAAVALGRGTDAILATDRAFDDVPGLERIDPADEEASIRWRPDEATNPTPECDTRLPDLVEWAR